MSILKRLLNSRMVWPAIDRYLIPLCDKLKRIREHEAGSRILKRLGTPLSVKTGPFAGLLYPSTSVGSSLLPKLLGTYEKELQPTFNSLMQQEFEKIIDIGCAEGYYANGIAMQFPSTPIFAFDTNPTARRLCAEMATQNTLKNVSVNGTLFPSQLQELCRGQKNLVLCDCEGFEKELFTKETVDSCSKAHVIIEIHDYVDRRLTGDLCSKFEGSHSVNLVNSISDQEKLHTYHSDFVANDTYERIAAFFEHRCEAMQWLVAVPKISQ